MFKYHMPTKLYSGIHCVSNNAAEIIKYGKRAMIVTGRNSGKKSGALDDVIKILSENNISYEVFDKVDNNPGLENVRECGNRARSFGAGFIIGIGGGSPLDMSKAAAVLAVNEVSPEGLFLNKWPVQPLPIVAIPTTAGTGSEVTPYSILTIDSEKTKKSFGNEELFPRAAFLDARYTERLPMDVTINTAIDAFCHAYEGYISNRSTPLSDVLAEEAIRLFGMTLPALTSGKLKIEDRERLLYASSIAGMVISQTGTTSVHGMGYSLTYFDGIPHGKANGLVTAEYLRFIYAEQTLKIDRILELLGLNNLDGLQLLLERLIGRGPALSDETLENYARMAMKQKSAGYNVIPVTAGDLFGILMRSCDKP